MNHSRFTLMPVATEAPGVCWVSKSPNGPLIDTGVSILFNERGRLYLGLDTLRDMAKIAGLFDEFEFNRDERDAEMFHKGYVAGVKEDLRGNLGNSVTELGFLIDTLRSFSLGGEVPDPAAGEAAGRKSTSIDTAKSKSARSRNAA